MVAGSELHASAIVLVQIGPQSLTGVEEGVRTGRCARALCQIEYAVPLIYHKRPLNRQEPHGLRYFHLPLFRHRPVFGRAILCRMATAVADWAHARAAREYARTLLTGPHCCATTSFDHASPTSHRAQRECPATQIARYGCRQHAWAVRAHRDTVILTQHNTSFQGHQWATPGLGYTHLQKVFCF